MLEEIEKVEEIKRVFTDKRDFPLSTIREMFADGDVIPQPDYQRDYVMDDKRASKLVESLLMGIPIPTVYLCEENDGTYSVIDGQQRMTSFVRYLNNDFSLKGLEELVELNGKKFKDLDKVYQRTLKSSSLNSIILTKDIRNACLNHLPSAKVIGNLEISIPGLESQTKFGEKINKIDKMIEVIENELNFINSLFLSKLMQYFK